MIPTKIELMKLIFCVASFIGVNLVLLLTSTQWTSATLLRLLRVAYQDFRAIPCVGVDSLILSKKRDAC